MDNGKAMERVLVVADDEQTLSMLQRTLETGGYEPVAARSALEARRYLEEIAFDVLVSDVDMPRESGLGLIEEILREHPDTATLMVSESDDAEAAAIAMDQGAYGYVVKPFSGNEILIAIANALRRRNLELDNRAHRLSLEAVIKARTDALERSATQLRLSREETIRRLSRAVEYRDEEAGGHTERMSNYAGLLARNLGRDAESIWIASPMHDVGKVALPDSILLNPGRLTPGERIEMERHTVIGYRILSGSGSALLELGASIALTHHEKIDGTGYPHGLAGDDIPIEGQIAAVADTFDALTSHRPYRPAFSVENAVEIMRAEAGKHFDPVLLDSFFKSMDEILEVIEESRSRSKPPPGVSAVGSALR